MSNEDLGARIEAIRKKAGLRQLDFCKVLGVSRASLHNYMKGERDLPSSILLTLHREFQADPSWVLLGEGEKSLSEHEKIIAENTLLIGKVVDERILELGMTVRPEKRDETVLFFLAEFKKNRTGYTLEVENVDRVLRLVAA
ncbi:transcriptional repressor DicA [Pseudovibrio axinellae]|uniref:Transcriptional repressor DicA n=1 Tax=Pseudovibrio axinellae TaxID=989403 RepID=A0A165Z655_9HYPH|nr:helix-turn-helix transcriptional regulator [Pseudovibrio axinellae]KZL19544.1 transcriptional repressor DicA [Pseudovibrio axinellae]SEQ31279.1 Helix-turn-helix [Pseudovibrio axinellae]